MYETMQPYSHHKKNDQDGRNGQEDQNNQNGGADQKGKNRHLLLLVSILALGLVLRLLWLFARWDAGFVLDEAEYVRIAEAIRAGGYLDNDRWLRPPLFPLWLAPLLTPGGGVAIARLAQVVLGTLLIVLIYRLTLAAWHNGPRALLAALLAALYFPLIAFSNYLMAETLLLVLLCSLLLVLLAFVRRPSPWGAAGAGVLLGLAMLTKPIALACVPALLVALWNGERQWATRLRSMSLALALCVLVLAPWTVRNWNVHQRFIPLDTTAGFNLWFGSRPPEQHRTLIENEMREAYPNPADRSAAYMHLALHNAQDNPAHTLHQFASRLRQFWRLQADVLVSGQHGELYLACPLARSIPKASVAEETFGQVEPACWWRWLNLSADLLYLPILAGVLLMVGWGERSPFFRLACTWALPLYLLTALTLVQPRLRLPLVPVLLPCAAAGLGELFGWLQRRRTGERGQGKGDRGQGTGSRLVRPALAIVLFLVMIWVVRVVPLVVSQGYNTLGMRAWHAGEPEQAMARYHSAARWYPTRVGTLVRAGQVAETLAEQEAALSWYQAAIHVVYYNAYAHIGTARILAKQENPDGAAEALRGSLLSSSELEQIGFATPILPPRNSLDSGGPPALTYGYVLGFYPADARSSATLPTFRWTGEYAAIRFGTQPTPETVLSLRLAASRPEGVSAPHGEFGINGSLQVSLSFAPEWRVYRLLVPPTERGVSLTMRADPFNAGAVTKEDPRNLGVAIDWTELVPVVRK